MCSPHLPQSVSDHQEVDDRSGCSYLDSDVEKKTKMAYLNYVESTVLHEQYQETFTLLDRQRQDWKSSGSAKTDKCSLHASSKDMPTHQAIKLWHWALVSRVTYVPHLNTSLPSSVNVSGGVADGNRTHHLSMVQCVDLTGVARYPWAHQSIRGEWNWLHLPISRYVKGVGTDGTQRWRQGWDFQRKVGFFSRGQSRSLNIQATTNTLTVCHQGFLSDWEAFQELACEDEDQNQPCEENKDIFMSTVQTHTHEHWQKDAHGSTVTCRSEHKHSWAQSKQDTLEHTHPLNLNDEFQSQQTHSGRAVSACAAPNQTHTYTHTDTRMHTVCEFLLSVAQTQLWVS